jgi:transposase-like protein
MTKKLAVSVPDDVAERLARETNVSAYVTEAVRQRMRSEQTREMLRSLGFKITDEGVARAGEEFRRLRESITPELRAEAAELYERIKQGRVW